jgi:hypothetical protein
MAALWLLASLLAGAVISPLPALVSAGLNLGLYPLLAALFGRLER